MMWRTRIAMICFLSSIVRISLRSDTNRLLACRDGGRSAPVAMAFAMFVVFLADVVIPLDATPYAIGVCIRNSAQCMKMFGPYF